MIATILFFIIVFLLIGSFVTIFLKYPFWHTQPMFHSYDFWRYIIRKPSIIKVNTSKKTSYYSSNVITQPFTDCLNKTALFELVKENVRYSETTFYTPTEKQWKQEYTNSYSYVSGYHIFDTNPSQIIACVFSRYAIFHTPDNTFPIYFLQQLSCNIPVKNKHRQKIMHQLLDTHFHNLYELSTKQVVASLCKKEGKPFGGLRPCYSHTYSFYQLPNTIPCQNASIRCKRIFTNPLDEINDFYDNWLPMKHAFIVERVTMLANISSEKWFVYCIYSIDNNSSTPIGYLFFANSFVEWNLIGHEEKELEFLFGTSTITSIAFFLALQCICKTNPTFSILKCNHLPQTRNITLTLPFTKLSGLIPVNYYFHRMVCPKLPDTTIVLL